MVVSFEVLLLCKIHNYNYGESVFGVATSEVIEETRIET